MADLVSNLLEQRRELVGRRSLGRALAAAATLHVAAAAAAIWAPAMLRTHAEPPRYVAVQIVPAAQLGIERPKPAPPPAKPEPAPKVEPQPKVEAPVLPDPRVEAPKPRERRPSPEPTTRPAPAAEPEPQGTPTGVASGLAIGAAVAALDNPSFTYGYYVDQMLAKISENWARPPVGSGVEAVLHFRIRRTGQIDDVRITRSSGINSFDLAALRAVQSSTPLPPLPRSFREESLGVNLIVR